MIYHAYRDERKLSMHPVMATNSSRVYFVHVLRVTKKKCLNGEKILNNCDTCTWVRFIFQILSKVSLSMTFIALSFRTN